MRLAVAGNCTRCLVSVMGWQATTLRESSRFRKSCARPPVGRIERSFASTREPSTARWTCRRRPTSASHFSCPEPMPLARQIGDTAFARSVESSHAGLVLVDFWAPGCAPCRAIDPVMEALAVAYDSRVRVVKVNIDESAATAARHDIQFIPTIALFDNGTIVARHVGPAPRATLEALLDDAIARRAELATDATTRVGVLDVFVFDPVISCATGLPHISLRRVRVLMRRYARAWRDRG